MNGRRNSPISIGMVSIVLIFVLLSLLTFSVLSLVTAQADLRLSQKSAQHTTEYYQAENEANGVLLDLEALADALPELEGDRLAAEVARQWAGTVAVEAADGVLRYTVPIGTEQELQVELVPEDRDGNRFRIAAWRSVSRETWTQQSGGTLLDPEHPPV